MEMRLEVINSIEAANAWLETFIDDFNRRFARPAKYPENLHRPVAELLWYRTIFSDMHNSPGTIIDNECCINKAFSLPAHP